MWHCPLGATADPRSWMGPLPPLSLSDEHVAEVGGRVEAPHIQVTQRERARALFVQGEVEG